MKKPGFGQGLASIFQAIGFLAKDPGSWPTAMVPTLIFLVLTVLGTIAGVKWLTPEVVGLLGLSDPQSWYGSVGQWAVKGLSTLFSALAGLLLAFGLTPPLSAPALEHLISEQETALGVPKRAGVSMLAELWCGLRAQFFGFAFAAPLLLALWILATVFPPLAVITTPLKVLVLALALAWNLFDYPLTLRGIPSGDRIGFILTNLPAVLGFGLTFSALFWVPCFGIVMLPVGAVAATRLVWLLAEAEPNELPSLPRAEHPRLGEMLDTHGETLREEVVERQE